MNNKKKLLKRTNELEIKFLKNKKGIKKSPKILNTKLPINNLK